MSTAANKAVLHTLMAIREGVDAAIVLLAEDLEVQCPHPDCEKAQWEDLTPAGQGTKTLYCHTCKRELEVELADG